MFGTRKLGRTSDQRKAMLRAMTTYLFENGKIETTFTRAKEVQPVAEKMITLGKKNTLASYRRAMAVSYTHLSRPFPLATFFAKRSKTAPRPV